MHEEKKSSMSDSSQPSLAEIACELLGSTNTGSLATHSVKHPAFPFASVVNYGVLPTGEPVFFLSSMSTHSKNLRANPKVSLLVYQSGDMASARATRRRRARSGKGRVSVSQSRCGPVDRVWRLCVFEAGCCRKLRRGWIWIDGLG